MPDILTHIAFADDVLEHMEDCPLKKQIQERIEIFRFGAQGPDFFFYHNFLYNKKDKVRSVGNFMHEKETGQFLAKCFHDLSFNKVNNDDYFDLLSYYIGFLCHYILDKNAHPFIYCYSGYSFEKGKEKGLYSTPHKKMENHIDVYIWHKKKHQHAYKERVDKLIFLKKGLPLSIKTHLLKNITHVYQLQLSQEEIEASYDHMVRALKLLFDPLNIKKGILKGLKQLRGKNFEIGKPMYTWAVEASMKYLNLEKNFWTHPLDASLVYNSSFLDIYNNAKFEGDRMLSQAVKALKKGVPVNPDIIGNRSYLTNFIWNSQENQIQAESVGLLNNEVMHK